MGFSLQIAPISNMVESEQDEQMLRELLARNRIKYSESFNLKNFSDPIFVCEESDDPNKNETYIYHLEVGWPWWIHTQILILETLGEEAVKHATEVHAWYGVAVPGKIEPTLIGEPVRREPIKEDSPDGTNASNPRELITRSIEKMVHAYGGDFKNLYVVSGTELLEEVEKTIRKANLGRLNVLELYESIEDEDNEHIATCNLLIVHKFLSVAMKNNHLVWWRK